MYLNSRLLQNFTDSFVKINPSLRNRREFTRIWTDFVLIIYSYFFVIYNLLFNGLTSLSIP